MTAFSRMSPLQALVARAAGIVARASVLGVFTLAFAAPAAHASPADVAELMNQMRANPSRCPGPSGLKQFVRTPELDRAAAMVANGATLKETARATGHEAVTLQGIHVTGSADQRAMETLLANGYCPFIVDPQLVEIGVHQQGTTTAVVLASAYAPAAGIAPSAIGARILALANQARAQGRHCGNTFFPAAGPLRWNDTLARAAAGHSQDMATNNYFNHNSPSGTSPGMRVERVGYDYRATAENIAAGQMTPEAAMAAWISSPGHCVNLMNAEYTEMGAALASNRASSLGAYWTQVFGTPMPATRSAKARKGRSDRA